MKAATLAVQGGTSDRIIMRVGTLLRVTAATLSVPEKLTQPCIARPGAKSKPAQSRGDPTPGQTTPQSKEPGST
jgi:hypothetical protein